MAIFSTNQARQFYVAKGTNGAIAAEGDIKLVAPTNGDAIYFQHVGKDGITRSDRIDVKNIISAKKSAAADLGIKLKLAKITAEEPILDEEYIMNITVAGGNYGISAEDTQTIFAGVKATSKVASVSDLYKHLAVALLKNKGIDEMVSVYLETLGEDAKTVGTITKVKHTDTVETLVGTYTGLVIEAVDSNAKSWSLGKIDVAITDFSVSFVTVGTGKEEEEWGTVNYVAPKNSIKDGKLIAQLEYFCMGERGDIYRQCGYPHTISTGYMVEPAKEYDVIDIHYSYIGSNESVQKSEKTITIVFPTENHVQRDAFVAAWNAIEGVPQLA